MRLVRQLSILTALARYYLRILPAGWYRRFPFVPVPPGKYLRWRFQTAYGQERPAWITVLKDVWQFGGWLADSSTNDRPLVS